MMVSRIPNLFLQYASDITLGSVMNGLQSLQIWRAYFKHPSASVLGTMNAVYPIGKFFGVFLTAWTGDRYGRKLPMYIGFLLLILGSGLQGGAHNVPMFIIARLILGFGTAFVAQPSPILIAELAYPLHRGRITSMYYSTYVSIRLLEEPRATERLVL
jgi:MFS family permease